jgi:hypothetical protein
MEYTAQDFANLFSRIGVNQQLIPILISQVAHETGGFKSKGLLTRNNASGIIWANSPNQLNASKGDPLPEDDRYYYANFDTLQDWANDYIRILSRGGDQAPIKQKNVTDFVAALKKNKYFSADQSIYEKAVQRFYNIYKDIKPKAFLSLGLLLVLGLGAFFILRKS